MTFKTCIFLLSFLPALGCSRAPETPTTTAATPVDTGPDNAFTHYGQALATAPGKAQAAADKANDSIKQREHQVGSESTP